MTARTPLDGAEAWRQGFAAEDCPHRDEYDAGHDYWKSEAGKRQKWLSDWRYAYRAEVYVDAVYCR